MKLEQQKAEARAFYIKMRDNYIATIPAGKVTGDTAAWMAFCEAKRRCRLLGVII